MKKIFVLSLLVFTAFTAVFASSGSTIPPTEKPVPEKPVVVTPEKPIRGLVILWDNYAVDSDSVYVVNDTRSAWAKIPNADRATFKVLGGQFARDREDVFQMGRKLVWADGGAFSIISGQHGYAQDNNHIYGPQGVILEADPETFKMLTKNYSIDAGHVFFDGANILEANSGSFRVINSGLYALDDKHVFYAGKLLKNALPEGFIVKWSRGFSTNGYVFFEGKVEKGDLPVDEPTVPEEPTVPSEPIEPTPVPTTDAWSLFRAKLMPYTQTMLGENALFWSLVGVSILGLFGILFVFFAYRSDEPVSVGKSITKTLIAAIVLSVSIWIFSLFLSPVIAIIIGAIIAFFFFTSLWSVLGWIKSLLITLLTLIGIVVILGVSAWILRAIFGDIESIISFINQSTSQLLSVLGIVWFFIGTWLIMWQLNASFARALGQAFVASFVALMILALLIWIIHVGSVVSVILFSMLYAVLLWIMRFRMVSNLFAETVRIIRVGLILGVILSIFVWIIL
jgi:hypothetical protein